MATLQISISEIEYYINSLTFIFLLVFNYFNLLNFFESLTNFRLGTTILVWHRLMWVARTRPNPDRHENRYWDLKPWSKSSRIFYRFSRGLKESTFANWKSPRIWVRWNPHFWDFLSPTLTHRIKKSSVLKFSNIDVKFAVIQIFIENTQIYGNEEFWVLRIPFALPKIDYVTKAILLSSYIIICKGGL